MYIWGHTWALKTLADVYLCSVQTGFLFLRISWNLEKLLLSYENNEWRMTHSLIHLKSSILIEFILQFILQQFLSDRTFHTLIKSKNVKEFLEW